MTPLQDILNDISIKKIIGPTDLSINHLVFDSRKVKAADLFVALKGHTLDGHQFIDKAIRSGATVIVLEELPATIAEKITYLLVDNSAEALGQMAAAFHGHPSQQLKLVGITGTNGKTTTATLLFDLFTAMGYKVGLLSTVANRIAGKTIPSTHTTPDAVGLNELLSEMAAAGCDYAFMEVSSHAIHQRRIAGITFTGGVFTNLTHEHLDYHGTFRDYIYAKKQFFDNLPKAAFALTNIDDKQGEVMVQNTKATVARYSLRRLTDYKARIIDNSLTGLHLELNGVDFFSRLIGGFNAYNLLAVYATAQLLEMDQMETLTQMSGLHSAEGRFEYLIHPKTLVYAIVDYAHTPDALEKVLSTLKKLRRSKEQILTVVGCGGDRDKRKRPIMADVAVRYSDQVILTADNPRTEDPEAIIREMEAGISATDKNKVLSITNREQAIRTACKLAQPGDFILVAGKGHEKYQEINGVKHPFDDQQIIKKIFAS